MIRRLRAAAGACRIVLGELRYVVGVLAASRRRRVVAYTKGHPIYTDVFEHCPPDGYVFYRRVSTRWLEPLDRLVWRRRSLVHYDAASARTPQPVPVVVECEGRPSDALLNDPAARHVFVESRWAGGEYLDRGRVTLLRPAIPLPSVAQRVRRDGTVTLLAVGYGGMVKGLDVVVKLYEHLKDRAPVRLVIAGSFDHNFTYYPEITRAAYDAADFPALERRLRADPRVRVGPVRRSVLLRRVYPSADIYVHLSRLETFGYSILEAMSHGLPVVASRLHAIPEMVRDGETGFLIDSGGADINGPEWVQRMFEGALGAVERLIADPALRRRLGEAGRARVRHAFDVEHKRRVLAQVYDRVLGEGCTVG